MEMHKADQVLSTAKRIIQLKLACNMNFSTRFSLLFFLVSPDWTVKWRMVRTKQRNSKLCSQHKWMRNCGCINAKLQVISFLDLANKYCERTLSVQMAVVRLVSSFDLLQQLFSPSQLQVSTLMKTKTTKNEWKQSATRIYEKSHSIGPVWLNPTDKSINPSEICTHFSAPALKC